MNTGFSPEELRLTEDEAFSLLGLCLTSPNRMDAVSERALRKLADYCKTRCHSKDDHNVQSDPIAVGARVW
jgi:hypothetical protein